MNDKLLQNAEKISNTINVLTDAAAKKTYLWTAIQDCIKQGNTENEIMEIAYYLEEQGLLLDLGMNADTFKDETRIKIREYKKAEEIEKKDLEAEKIRNSLDPIATKIKKLSIGIDKTHIEVLKELQAITREAEKILDSKIYDTLELLENYPTKEEITELLQNEGDGYKTGYQINTGKQNPFDITFKPAALTFVAGATKHGKTTFAINLFMNILDKYPDKIHYFFSYEENKQAIITKMFSCYYGKEISHDNYSSIKHYLKTGSDTYFNDYCNPIDFNKKEKQFWQIMKNANVIYKNHTLTELCKLLQLIADDPRTGVVFIDHLQLIPVGEAAEGYKVIKQLCNGLKDTAVSTGLSVVILTQFNRTVTNPENMLLQNLSEGSDIEKSANQVIGLWNFGKAIQYKNTTVKTKKYDTWSGQADKVLIKILANRDGPAEIEGVFACDYNVRRIYTEQIIAQKSERIIKS